MTTVLGPRAAFESTQSKAKRWHLAHYFALCGLLFLFWEGWTVVAWLADGPHQLTTGRAVSGTNFLTARFYEVAQGTIAAFMVVYLVRKYRRERRFSFDHQLVVAGLLSMWVDSICEWFMPLFSYGTNWLNLNYFMGYAPGVTNPAMKDLPWPIVANTFLYGFVLPAVAILCCKAITAMKARSFSSVKIVTYLLIFGALLDIAYEGPLYLTYNFNYLGLPEEFAILGKSSRFPILEILMAAPWFVILGFLRHATNDRGETLLERGLERHSPKVRLAISQTSLIFAFGLSTIVFSIPIAFAGFYSDPPRPRPASAVAEVCDAPIDDGTVARTRYGPCPGSTSDTGFLMPLRGYPPR